jgi:Zn-dependent M28 family amino/carboxypeptidase
MNFARVAARCTPLAVLLTLSAGAQTAAPDAAQRDRLKADVQRVAIDRAPGSEGWNQVRTLIENSFDRERFQVETHAFDQSGRNVIATRKGTTSPEQVVVLSAHYDHIRGCKGADDNASGVAVVLEAARQLSQRSFPRTLVLAFWDHEEDGLLGSRAWALQARQRGTDIRVMISLDGVAFARHTPDSQRMPQAVGVLLPDLVKRLAANEGRANFIAGLGDSASVATLAQFEAAGAAVGQTAFGIELPGATRVLLADAARSDHASFWLAGYPGILITDTANFRNPNYHCGSGSDDPDTLDYDFLNKVASVVIRTVEASLQAASTSQ